jgi:hypothetical protein
MNVNGGILILFIILLLALVLSSFLGGSKYSEGFTSTNINGTYTGDNGVKAVVTDNTIVFTYNGNVTTLTKNASDKTYTNTTVGYTATFNSDGNLVITDSDGKNIYTTSGSNSDNNSDNNSNNNSNNNSSTNYDNYNHYDGSSYPTIYYGPNGSTARVINVDGQGKIVITNANGTTNIYYIDSSSNATVKTYKGQNGGTAVVATDSNGKKIVKITMPDKTIIVYNSDNTYASNSQDPTMNQSHSNYDVNTYYGPSTAVNANTYASSLPAGIPASQIPSGQEDLYILKSQIVPPVCPKCPDPIMQSSDKFDATKCPPCPPCARCPEPNFSCKKVPNYNTFNPDIMPVPVLSDFSSFGM